MPLPPPAPAPSFGPVTVAITPRVSPDDQLLMQVWADAGTSMARHFPGFLGSGWVRPSPSSPDWHMLYRFDSRASLKAWERSPERMRWLRAGSNLVQDTRVEHRTGIEGWFDEPAERAVDELATALAPPRWKQAVVIWVGFFPTSLLLTSLLGGLIDPWPTALRVLATTLVATPLMTYLILPWVTRLFQHWLTRSRLRA